MAASHWGKISTPRLVACGCWQSLWNWLVMIVHAGLKTVRDPKVSPGSSWLQELVIRCGTENLIVIAVAASRWLQSPLVCMEECLFADTCKLLPVTKVITQRFLEQHPLRSVSPSNNQQLLRNQSGNHFFPSDQTFWECYQLSLSSRHVCEGSEIHVQGQWDSGHVCRVCL